MTMIIDIDQLRLINPLIWAEQGDVDVSLAKPNIFLGGGIATKNKISQGVPFDLIGFILTAEQARRKLGSEVHMLIADQHAWLANNLNQKEGKLAAQNLLQTTHKIINQLKLVNWHLHLASDIFPDAIPQSYEDLEIRDIDHFASHFKCGIKIGWTFSPNEIGQTDESHFDKLHNMSTILIKPGVTLDQFKPHESPYICTDPTTRITLDNHQDISTMISSDTHRSNTVSNHLRSICLLFANLINPFPPKTPLSKKVAQINQLIFSKNNKD